jgi:hypothetical protein
MKQKQATITMTNAHGTKSIASKANPSKEAQQKAEVKQLNREKAGKDAAIAKGERELKYQYPEDVQTAQDKKVFRRNARAAAARFEKKIQELSNSKDDHAPQELKKVQKERAAFEAVTYTHKA